MSVKLNHQLAQIIRDRFTAGVPGKVLAFEYGVSKATISMIITGKIWTCPSQSNVTVQVASICSPPSRRCGFWKDCSALSNLLACPLTEA